MKWYSSAPDKLRFNLSGNTQSWKSDWDQAQKGVVRMTEYDIMTVNQTEWTTTIVNRRSNGKCPDYSIHADAVRH